MFKIFYKVIMSIVVNVVDISQTKLSQIISRILTEIGVKFNLATSQTEITNIEQPNNFNFWVSNDGWWYGESHLTRTAVNEVEIANLGDLSSYSSLKNVPELKSTFDLLESCAEQYEFEGYRPSN